MNWMTGWGISFTGISNILGCDGASSDAPANTAAAGALSNRKSPIVLDRASCCASLYLLNLLLTDDAGIVLRQVQTRLGCFMRFAASPTLPSPLSIVAAVAGDAVGWV